MDQGRSDHLQTLPSPSSRVEGIAVKGIRRDRWGYRAYVKVGTIQREKRFPSDAKPSTMQNWRAETRVALRKRTPQPPAAGSL